MQALAPTTVVVCLLVITSFAYMVGKRRALSVAEPVGGPRALHSLPRYHGAMTALICTIPALVLLALWLFFHDSIVTQMVVADLPQATQDLPAEQLGLVVNDIRNIVSGNIASSRSDEMLAAAEQYKNIKSVGRIMLLIALIALVVAGLLYSYTRIRPRYQARQFVERSVMFFLIASSSIAILTTVGIVFSVLFESIRFFEEVSWKEFLTGLKWSPQTAIRADQVGSSGAFGAIPLFTGTLLISFIAMLVAVPLGLMSAIYLAEYARPNVRAIAKPLLEILAGIPTVVYGFFAALVVAPIIRDAGTWLGLNVASESALAAGLVMGVMIIPFVSSLSDDVITAVPQSLRDGSLGLGATQSETIRRVILPAALPGIVGGVLLAVSRAIGETMIVVMAAGLAANLTANPLEAVTTVTVQIVTLLVGDQEFDSAKTLAAFALGLILFLVTLVLNVIALYIVRRYREQYD